MLLLKDELAILEKHEVIIKARENSGWWIECKHADVAAETLEETIRVFIQAVEPCYEQH